MLRDHPSSRTVLLLVLCLSIVVTVRWRLVGDDGNAWKYTVASDGAGYYAYLTSLRFGHGLRPPAADPGHLSPTPNGPVLKYTVGTALLESPFFLVASIKDTFSQRPEDGRSVHYAIGFAICGTFYLLFGLYCVQRILLLMGMDDAAIALTLVVLVLGTGLGYYAWMEPSMSHVYSFAMIAGMLHAAQRAWTTGKAVHLFALAAYTGMAILIRPVNAVAILALPLATFGHRQPLRTWLMRMRPVMFLSAALLVLVITALQPLLWYLQCGQWWVRPYPTEGFNWTSPQVWRSLFGAQKGLFFLWPLLLLCVAGIVPMARHSWKNAVVACTYAALVVYITSAWWCWTYAGGYGSRPYLDHLAFAAVPIALFFKNGQRSIRLFSALVVVPLIALQCFQAWQHTTGILHCENMDREKWACVFLESDKKWRHALGGAYEAPPFAPCGMQVFLEAGPGSPFPKDMPIQSNFPEDRDRIVELDPEHSIGPTVVIPVGHLPAGHALLVEGSVEREEPWPGSSNGVLVVCTLGSMDSIRVYWSFRMNDLPDVPGWRHWRHSFNMLTVLPGEEFRYYYWLLGDGACRLRSPRMKLSIVAPCPEPLPLSK